MTNYLFPHVFHRLKVRTPRGSRVERVPGKSTYFHQLDAFQKAVRSGGEVPTSAQDAVTMALIDEAYRAAGLPLRGDAGHAAT